MKVSIHRRFLDFNILLQVNIHEIWHMYRICSEIILIGPKLVHSFCAPLISTFKNVGNCSLQVTHQTFFQTCSYRHAAY